MLKQRRDAALARMAGAIPYVRHLGVVFDRRGDELTAQLPYDERLVGNPVLPALHGGAIGAFLEIAAIMELAWSQVWERMESGGPAAGAIEAGRLPAAAEDHRLHRRLPALRAAARRLCPGAGQPGRAALCERACRGLAGQPRAAVRAGDRAFPDAARGAVTGRAGRPCDAGAGAAAITHRRVLTIALPIVLSNATIPILGAVDTAVVGQLGQAAPIGAVGIGAVILTTIYWVFGFLRMGTTGLVAQARGAGEVAETGALLMRGLMIAGAAGLVFVVGQAAVFWAAFRLAPASAEVEALARSYLGDPHLGGAGDDRALRADRLADRDGADARRCWCCSSAMNGVNVVLDLLFVLGFGWGVAGVAAATLIAEWSGLLLGLWLCRAAFAGDAVARLGAGVRSRRGCGGWRAVNRDILIRSVILQASFTSFLFLGAGLGDVTLAANQVLLQFLSITAYALDGFAFAAEALVGQTLGRARPGGAAARRGRHLGVGRRLLRWCWRWPSSLAGPALIDLMATAPEVRAEARAYLPWLAAAPLVGIAAWMLDGIFIGATETRAMRNADDRVGGGLRRGAGAARAGLGQPRALGGADDPERDARGDARACAIRRWRRGPGAGAVSR